MEFEKKLRLVKPLILEDLPPVSKLPQLYRASLSFLRDLEDGKFSKLAHELLAATHDAAEQFKYCSIDSRSHMLMTGMYPCIPGWHCDDFYRPECDLDGQPDLENVLEKAPQRHFAFILGDNSRTEFVDENIDMPTPAGLQLLYGTEHPIYYHYDKMLERIDPKTVFLEPGNLYEFGPLDFHRGRPAAWPGWRYFFRMTFSNHREPKNEIRYQTQVYTTGRVSW